MALVSPEGKFLKVNHSLAQLVAYPEDEFLTKTFQDITHPDDWEADLDYLQKLIDNKIPNYKL